MDNELLELNQKASGFIDAIRKEYLEMTGKELPVEKVFLVALEALRERSEECGMNVLVKALERSGVLNKE